MTLSEKYGIPDEVIKKMIRDGVVPTCYRTYEEISSEVRQDKANGVLTTQAIHNASIKHNISERQVWNIVNIMK